MMGTGEFALPTLRALCDSPHEVVGLVTQPDRTGRGHHHHVNPLKELALEHGVHVWQPERVNDDESLEQLRSINADLYVVAAYGQILSSRLLAIPRLGAINLHGSLLPKYRGAAPVQYAVLNGETRTGVTIFQIEPKLDAGLILGQVETEIGPRETSGELMTRIAELAVPLTLEIIDALEHGTARGIPQDPAGVTLAPRMLKEMGLIDWSQPAERIDWHIRAMQPWPMPFTFLHQTGKAPLRMLVLAIEPAGDEGMESLPGTVVSAAEGRLFVRAGDQSVELLEVQPAGKRKMAAAEFLRGHAVRPGDRLGPEGP
jgi:methionyl-tRNA formyltransferase